MTLTVRVYATEKQARDAAKKLKSEGFGDDAVFVMAPKEGANVGAEVAAAVKGDRLPESYSQIAAANLRQGRAVVTVNPPFGHGHTVNEVLDSFDPVAIKEAPSTVSSATKQRFMSDSLGMPLLWKGKSFLAGWFAGELSPSKPQAKLSDEPAPLSKRLGMTVLSETKKDWNASMGQPTLSSKRFILGEPQLSSDPAPLSTRLGMTVLSESKKDWTHSFGQPLLSSDPTPLSTKLGLRVLSD